MRVKKRIKKEKNIMNCQMEKIMIPTDQLIMYVI